MLICTKISCIYRDRSSQFCHFSFNLGKCKKHLLSSSDNEAFYSNNHLTTAAELHSKKENHLLGWLKKLFIGEENIFLNMPQFLLRSLNIYFLKLA